MQKLTTYLWLAPIFVLIQILLLNNIQFFRYINPLVYLILIITLPQDTEKWFIILYAFFIGILLDLFEAEEVFCTGTAVQITPVGRITYKNNVYNYCSENLGPIPKKLKNTLTKIQSGEINDLFGWLSPVMT